MPEAAAALGITEAAVRGRIKRGTLRSFRNSGAVYVLLEGVSSAANRDEPDDQPSDKLSDQSELVEELRNHVAFLERELERRGNETERLHQIVAGLSQANAEQARTIRAIEAPQEDPEAAETVEEEPESAEPRSDTPSPQTAAQRPQRGALRGLRRLIFGR